MRRLIIICPDCGLSEFWSLSVMQTCAGEIKCECGTAIQFTVNAPKLKDGALVGQKVETP